MKSQATMKLEEDVRALLNRHSAENASDTPDFILAGYLMAALGAFNVAVRARERWYKQTPDESPAVAAETPEQSEAIVQANLDRMGVTLGGYVNPGDDTANGSWATS